MAPARPFENWLCDPDFDELTTEATELQLYAMRLCYSVNQSDLPLAEQLRKSL